MKLIRSVAAAGVANCEANGEKGFPDKTMQMRKAGETY